MLTLSTGLRNKLLGVSVNMLTNGDFASNITGWTNTVGASWASASPPSGATGYLLLTPSGAAGGEARYTAAITVGAGQLHRVKFYAKYPGTAAGNVVVNVGTTAGASNILTETVATTASWVQYDVMFRVPDGVTSVYLTFLTSNVTAANTLGIGLINFHNNAASLQEIFRKGFLKIYSGSQPSTSDSVASGTLLCSIYSDGTATGLTFDDSTGGVISKAAAEMWSGTAIATATAGWFRFQTNTDTGASSSTECRIDGAVSTSGAQLNMSSTSVTSSAVQTISTFTVTMPAS